MTATLSDIRQRARRHEEEIDSARWYTPAQLAKKWQVSQTTVRETPWEKLRYKEMGNGTKLKRRRYREDWVRAFEEANPELVKGAAA